MDDTFNLEDINVEHELRILFMGTPEFSVPILKGLIENYKVRAVVTQPDRKVGRSQTVRFSPVKEEAMQHALLVIQPEKIKESVEEIALLQPDLIITCAYGQILPKALLDIPRLGCINVHASLLPKLRGGAPIHHAIMDGYQKTGITIMYMNPKMDEGDMIAQEEIEILETDTASTLHDTLSKMGRDLLLKTLPSIIDGTNTRTPQDSEKATYGFVITRQDEKVHFSKTQREIYNQIRGLDSFPGAYARLDGKIMKLWACQKSDAYPTGFDGQITNIYPNGIGVKVSNGEIIVTELQPDGKKRMKAQDYINGIGDPKKLIGKIFE